MKRCAEFEELMADSLYGVDDDDRRVRLDEHIQNCETCARLLEELHGTLELMSRYERRDPGPEFWGTYWDRLVARMESEDGAGVGQSDDTTQRAWWRARVGGGRVASWTYRVAAVAAILLMGVYVGRTFLVPDNGVRPPVVVTQDTAPDAVEGNTPPDAGVVTPTDESGGAGVELASSARAMRYVEKSHMLLLALVNNDPDTDGYAASLETRRARSRKLLGEAPSIKEDLNNPRQRRLRELVAELEKILVQIANLESEEDFEEVEFIRGRVNRHDVLLKINLEQLKHADGPARNSSAADRVQEPDPRKGSI